MRAGVGGGRRGRRGALALGLAVALGAAPRAQAADAAQLEAQLHDWLAAVLGPHADLGARPVRVTPQGGHFMVEVPVAGAVGSTAVTLQGPPLTATATPLEGGRWALDSIRFPSPLHITTPTHGGEDRWTITVHEQDQHAVLDPSLATTSTFDGRIGGYAMHAEGPGGQRDSEAANIRTHVVWQAAGPGRIDVTETSSSDLLTRNDRVPRLSLVSMSAAHAQVSAHVDHLAPGQMPPLLHAMFDLAPLLQQAAERAAPGPGPRRITPAMRASLADMLDAAGDLLGGFGEQAVFENVHIHARGLDAAMRRAELGIDAGAPDGRLRLRLHFGMDGFDSGALPSPPLRSYVPQHISVTTRLGGISAERAFALLRHAVATGGENPALGSEAQALMRSGPLDIGIDEIAADFGPAVLSASGEVRVAGPNQVSGQAHVRITGMDRLIHDAQGEPMLKQVLPFLIFLKGIGETEGAATVWNVAYSGTQVTVNGTDLSQMLPMAK